MLGLVLFLHLATQLPWRIMRLGVGAAFAQPQQYQTSQGSGSYWQEQLLEAKLLEAGYVVTYAPILREGALGRTIYQEHTIQLERSLSWDDKYAVLGHEAGHALSPLYLRGGGAEAEVFADAVSVLICRCGHGNAARYLASARGSLPTLFWYWPDIYRVAAFFR